VKGLIAYLVFIDERLDVGDVQSAIALEDVVADMLVHVAPLGETGITVELISKGTNEGPVIVVDADVVIEIMALTEDHLASRVVALRQLQIPVGLRVPIAEDPERSFWFLIIRPLLIE
jgi:hypothetical protein